MNTGRKSITDREKKVSMERLRRVWWEAVTGDLRRRGLLRDNDAGLQ